MTSTAVIAGLGPGFCEEFAWTLAREGHPVGLFARSEDYPETFAQLDDLGFDAEVERKLLGETAREVFGT